jgi:hypothetical protein
MAAYGEGLMDTDTPAALLPRQARTVSSSASKLADPLSAMRGCPVHAPGQPPCFGVFEVLVVRVSITDADLTDRAAGCPASEAGCAAWLPDLR